MEATLGVLQRFVADGRDGWEFALDRADGVPRARARARRGHRPDALRARLGRHAIRTSHRRSRATRRSACWSRRSTRRSSAPSSTCARTTRWCAPILGRGQELRERLQLLSQQSAGGRLIRQHGDYHLGQTLLSPDGWIILDFEGEPARTLPERRRRRSPLRDTAGMLRSFAYAASSRELPDGWEAEARTLFLEGYFGTVEPVLMPAGEASIARLLAIHELEKAIYELRYELNNRPDWVGIPVAAIQRLLDDPLD